MTNWYSIIVPAIITIIAYIATYSATFSKRATQIDRLISDYEKLTDKLEKLSDTVTEIKTTIRLCLPETNSVYSQHNSPIGLSDQGKSVSEELNAQEIIEAHFNDLSQKLDANKLGNAYDIQQETFRVIMSDLYDMLTEQEMTKLKEIAFQKGEPIGAYIIIFQILFRNKILISKGIDINEIDKYAPTQHAAQNS